MAGQLIPPKDLNTRFSLKLQAWNCSRSLGPPLEKSTVGKLSPLRVLASWWEAGSLQRLRRLQTFGNVARTPNSLLWHNPPASFLEAEMGSVFQDACYADHQSFLPKLAAFRQTWLLRCSKGLSNARHGHFFSTCLFLKLNTWTYLVLGLPKKTLNWFPRCSKVY